MPSIAELKRQGATPVEISLPNVMLSVPVYYVVAPAECSSNLSRFDGSRVERIERPTPAQLVEWKSLDVVLGDGSEHWLKPWRRALAERQGPRVPLVGLAEGPQRLVHERVISVDTTASGGNTSLLSMAS